MRIDRFRVVGPEQFDSGTAQTPGSLRLAAIHSGAGIESPIWGGMFRVEPGARPESTTTGSRTRSSMSEWRLVCPLGRGREFSATAHAGTFFLSRVAPAYGD